MVDYTEEDVGNIVSLEHINVQVPDQAKATAFYIVGLGMTRDPYLNVGLRNMWANMGEQQFHLPTRSPQKIDGHIGLVFPELDSLRERLSTVESLLEDSQFSWSDGQDYIAVTCPWGNHFRCHAAGPDFQDMAVGISYVEFLVPIGVAGTITHFYRNVFETPTQVEENGGGRVSHVMIGRNQSLRFRETERAVAAYDGHHIAIYVANFSGPYGFLKGRGLISEDVRNHQFRFQTIVDPDSCKVVFLLEHEVRSLRHSMYNRPFVNRDPKQSQRNYCRGRDAINPHRC
jgi:hypothetical protein